jgi:uncharacterized protein
MNHRLAKEKSPYLRHAADQKIDWYPWCDEAFDRAMREDKPIFLSSGAVWCHWCHVMAKESFYDEEISRILNERFICIKLDRDERPDIDRVYQQAVGAMVGAGGWPLSVFLAPDAKPFYGGSYFPPDGPDGRPGFRNLLLKVADIYTDNKDEIGAYVAGLIDALKFDDSRSSDYSLSVIEKAELAFVGKMDIHNGGFGNAPKFPMTGTYDFMLGRCFFEGSDKIRSLMNKTLTRMAMGGIYDHLQGGFHRYSTDAEWIIPHFEKMADDNARLLINYSNALSMFNDEVYRSRAVGVARFLTETLADPKGGFYSSQDADVTPDDEGGYFTWTENALKSCIDKAAFDLLSRHFFDQRGIMGHDPLKHVLFAARPIPEIAAEMGISEAQALTLFQRGTARLLEERFKREAPLLDKTLYSSLNGLVISALFNASWVLDNAALVNKALKGLNRILDLRLRDGVLFHTTGVAAVLDDYIFLAEASIAAYETTGSQEWLTKAIEIIDICIARLWDKEIGGFFDFEADIIGIRPKSIDDAPHPSANAVAIRLFQKLYILTEKDIYKKMPETALKAFFEKTSSISLHWAAYYSALEASARTLKLEIYDAPDSELARTARSSYYPYKSIKFNLDMRGYVVPCLGRTCYDPLRTAQELKDYIAGLGKIKPGIGAGNRKGRHE